MTKFFGLLIALCQTVIIVEVKLHMNLMNRSKLKMIMYLTHIGPCHADAALGFRACCKLMQSHSSVFHHSGTSI